MQASTRGRFGWSNDEGGLFTCVLMRLLCERRAELSLGGADSLLSWTDLLMQLWSQSVALFEQTRPRGTRRTDGELDILEY